jgi:hypothetical protein
MRLVKLASGSKEPIPGVSWKKLISDDPAVHQQWIAEGFNVGFPPAENGCSAADFDIKAIAKEWWIRHHKENLWNVAVETRRGIHLIFRGRTRTRKLIVDGKEAGDIKGNGYLVFPPSVVRDRETGHLWQYRFVPGFEMKPLDELRPFSEHLFPADRVVRGISRETVKSVTAYLAKVESVQGQHGSAGLVRAAAICRDAGLSEAEAMVRLIAWNQGPTVQPSWSLAQLRQLLT